tara:strand:- start:74 stop:991 length:918 start_codon:yes stop_codon:yes gene_type:complete
MSILNVNKINPVGGGSTITITGIASVTNNISVGNSVTATTYFGDGSQLTGIDATKIETGNTKVETIDTGSDGHIKITTEGTERVRIDSAGRLLLGTTTVGDSSSDDLIIATSGRTGMTIRSGSSNNGIIHFADATSGGGEYVGAILYSHNTNHMRFDTNGTEKLRITSEGYVKKPNQPVFDVCGASGNPSGAGYITFTTVKVNIGSHYSTSTGKFIAPVAGTYFFSFGCIKSGNSSLARLYLYKNGSSANGRQLRMPTGGDGYGENGAKTNIVTLAANDEIQVYMSEGTVHGGTAYLYFNGYLIG